MNRVSAVPPGDGLCISPYGCLGPMLQGLDNFCRSLVGVVCDVSDAFARCSVS